MLVMVKVERRRQPIGLVSIDRCKGKGPTERPGPKEGLNLS